VLGYGYYYKIKKDVERERKGLYLYDERSVHILHENSRVLYYSNFVSLDKKKFGENESLLEI